MCTCNWQFTQLLCCFFQARGRGAHSMLRAVGADQPSRKQRRRSRAKAAKGNVFGSYICSKSLQAPGLVHVTLAVTTFRLYVAGDAPNSAQALAEDIFLTPTFIKLGPLPQRRIVGTLSQTQVVMQALGLEAVSV